eukprot:jgi/Bigna1/87089/estExt_fgenesh1_pg.C_160203
MLTRFLSLILFAVALTLGQSQNVSDCVVVGALPTDGTFRCFFVTDTNGIAFSWVANSTDIRFEVLGQVESYVALGFNQERLAMDPAIAMIGSCLDGGANTMIADFQLAAGRVVTQLAEQALVDIQCQQMNGITTIQFDRPLISPNLTLNLTEPVNVIWANGNGGDDADVPANHGSANRGGTANLTLATAPLLPCQVAGPLSDNFLCSFNTSTNGLTFQWVANATDIRFEVSALVDGYVAIGFNEEAVLMDPAISVIGSCAEGVAIDIDIREFCIKVLFSCSNDSQLSLTAPINVIWATGPGDAPAFHGNQNRLGTPLLNLGTGMGPAVTPAPTGVPTPVGQVCIVEGPLEDIATAEPANYLCNFDTTIGISLEWTLNDTHIAYSVSQNTGRYSEGGWVGFGFGSQMIGSTAMIGWCVAGNQPTVNDSVHRSRWCYHRSIHPSASNVLVFEAISLCSALVMINFNDGTGQNIEIEDFVTIHSAFMWTGFCGLMPLAMFAARYMKPLGAVWFYTHITLQTIAVAFTCVGFAFALRVDDDGERFEELHGRLGLSLFIAGLVQFLGGVLRPHKVKPEDTGSLSYYVRTIWSWGHKLTGLAIVVLAAVNVFEGLDLDTDSEDIYRELHMAWYVLRRIYSLFPFKYFIQSGLSYVSDCLCCSTSYLVCTAEVQKMFLA